MTTFQNDKSTEYVIELIVEKADSLCLEIGNWIATLRHLISRKSPMDQRISHETNLESLLLCCTEKVTEDLKYIVTALNMTI